MEKLFNQSKWGLLLCILISCQPKEAVYDLKVSYHDLHFNQLPKVWDEGIPLGNGMLGALIWEKEGKLRFSLDRADLWDLRPMENLQTAEWKFDWVKQQWETENYRQVQEKFDVPYDRSPAPSKIPGAGLEFDISELGPVASVRLHLETAICEVRWESGATLQTFVHATDPIAWFRFEGVEQSVPYVLIPPAYNLEGKSEADNPVTGQDLRRLEYPKGIVVNRENSITYEQEGWGGFKYQVNVTGNHQGDVLEGCWSISSEYPEWEVRPSAVEVVNDKSVRGMAAALASHEQWWIDFWNKSDIQVPDTILQKQWYLEQYKFGSVARSGAPPISLQAVWTADNGKLPPWKGDFHHDLNTQLSYWPAYSGNHLDEAVGFLDWLWKYQETFRKYTRDYFEADGLNVPGVTTLTGDPMGGWIQYSFGPTVSSWLAQHFYLHWRYTMDRNFLEQRAYPWIRDVAIYLEGISEKGEEGMRKLPISSSPEIHNNSREAWFGETTNFDLALIRWTLEKAAELAQELGEAEAAAKWKKILNEWPALSVDDVGGLMIAPEVPYTSSHRHFSHLMAYHPLGLIDFSGGKEQQQIITNTISTLDDMGSSQWVGYSFSWLANLKARAFDGVGAAETLRTFATSFCLPNSFHVNGDQSGKGLSNFTYRPFTLEGNFAFAAGLQEMLIQSHTGTLQVFPAVPADWQDISFHQLRTEGAFLVSAEKTNGMVNRLEIESTKGGILKLRNPFPSRNFKASHDFAWSDEVDVVITTQPGDKIILSKD